MTEVNISSVTPDVNIGHLDYDQASEGVRPVVASLWHAENRRGQGRADLLRESVRNILTNVLCRFGDKTGAEIIASAHAEDPWLATTQDGTVIANQLIPHESLAHYLGTDHCSLRRQCTRVWLKHTRPLNFLIFTGEPR